MIRSKGRRKPCDVGDAKQRFSKAQQFRTVAAAVEGDETLRSAEVANLVHAGILYADVICCVRLGERSADGDHGAAIDLLRRVEPQAAKRLQVLLALKSAAEYGVSNPASSRMQSARRAAEALHEAAATVLSET